jgi:LysR family glycine cleavage system transcriptional activator
MTGYFRNLPSLQALRCFEAAARLGSFALAADELCITQSAISHQIRSLEEGAGQPLFQRTGNRITLTLAGRVLAAETRRALDYLSRAYGVVDAGQEGSKTLTLAVQFAITEHWLVPRLSELRKALPETALRIVSLVDLVETPPETADAAILYGMGDVPGMIVERIADEQVFPVCSPDFLARHPDLSIERMADLPLLLHSHATWSLWLEKAGLPIRYPKDSIFFDDVALTIRSALAGQGIAMARSHLVQRYLSTGRLIRLFDLAVPGIFSYFLAWGSEATKTKHHVFRRWLLDTFSSEIAPLPAEPMNTRSGRQNPRAN